jgi:hypothetical protein
MLSNSLVELDRAHLIHPVASYRCHEAVEPGVRSIGVRNPNYFKGGPNVDSFEFFAISGRERPD